MEDLEVKLMDINIVIVIIVIIVFYIIFKVL